MFTRFQTTVITLIGLAAMVFAPLVGATLFAQETAAIVPVEFTGTVDAINGSTISVSGVVVDVSGIDISIRDQLTVSTAISITGTLENDIVIATTIVIVNTGPVNPPDPEATPEATPDPEATPEITPEPTPETPITIVVEGPVEAINVNIITIFNIDIEVEPTAPILTEIHIGDHIRVEGNPTNRGDTIIIVAVNITIVNVIVVENNPDVIIVNPGLPENCKITGMGHIKCTKKRTKRS